MARRRFHKFRNKKMSKQEQFQWLLVAIVFTVVFIPVLIYLFFAHCVFEWPIRWDVGACWHEQIGPARDAAVEKAVNFVP